MGRISRKTFITAMVIIVLTAGVGFWHWSQKKVEVPPPEIPKAKDAVGTAKAISESVPEIRTNTGEEVPEINPLDRANPFKYKNPLR